MMTTIQDKKDIQGEMEMMTPVLLRAATGGYPYEKGESLQRYLKNYGLNFADAEHRMGWFESGGMKLAGNLWMPCSDGLKPILRNLVIVLHGYMNHTGQMRHLIAGLLEAGFAVGAFDLPGHGLSEGKPAAGTIEAYSQAVLDFAAMAKAMGFGRLDFVGFSTGCAVGVEGLLGGRGDLFERVVLVSPLVRWRGYQVSKITYSLYRPFMDKIKRVPQRNSSDAEFLYFNRHKDYLHCRHVSLDWVEGMFAWNEKIERGRSVSGEVQNSVAPSGLKEEGKSFFRRLTPPAMKLATLSGSECTDFVQSNSAPNNMNLLRPCEKPMLILQGDRDTTVDWRYNVRLLRDKFPAANVEMIPGARHELLNEAAEYRSKVIGRIVKELKIDNW